MISVRGTPAGETLILFRLPNGWTASVAPNADGTATLVAWPGHEDPPRVGLTHIGVCSAFAGETVAFLADISQCSGDKIL